MDRRVPVRLAHSKGRNHRCWSKVSFASHSSYHFSPAHPCSGLVAYRELTEAGLDVRIFERDSVPGGNWHYTEEVPLDAPVPNVPTPTSDFVPSLPPEGVDLPYSEEFEDNEIWKDHSGLKLVWESLTMSLPSVRRSVLSGG